MISLEESKVAAPTATLDEMQNYHERHSIEMHPSTKALLEILNPIRKYGHTLPNGIEAANEALKLIRQIRADHEDDEASNSTYRHISSFLPQQDDT